MRIPNVDHAFFSQLCWHISEWRQYFNFSSTGAVYIHVRDSDMVTSMMTSSNGIIFRVTDPLCGEFTGNRWIPTTTASGSGLWCLLWSAPEKNGCANNRGAGDLRRLRSHCAVTVISTKPSVDTALITESIVLPMTFIWLSKSDYLSDCM